MKKPRLAALLLTISLDTATLDETARRDMEGVMVHDGCEDRKINYSSVATVATNARIWLHNTAALVLFKKVSGPIHAFTAVH